MPAETLAKQGVNEEKEHTRPNDECPDRSSTSPRHGILLSAAHTYWQRSPPYTVPDARSMDRSPSEGDQLVRLAERLLPQLLEPMPGDARVVRRVLRIAVAEV